MIDYHFQNPTRRCAATGRDLQAGEEYVAEVIEGRSQLERRDFATAGWNGPHTDAIAWWRGRLPSSDKQGTAQTPLDVILQVFDRWHAAAKDADRAYLLALLLVRRRVFRIDADSPLGETTCDQMLHVTCPRRQAAYSVPVVAITRERQAELQVELQQLVYGDPA